MLKLVSRPVAQKYKVCASLGEIHCLLRLLGAVTPYSQFRTKGNCLLVGFYYLNRKRIL